MQLRFFLLTGWLIPAGLAIVFFGLWIIDIVIPTLKGGSFDQLYDLHQIRYLDTTLGCTAVAFVWLAFAVFRWARREEKSLVTSTSTH
jgi:hypothetical protein